MKALCRFWIDTFWKSPARLYALKVTIAIALGLFPALFFGDTYGGAIFSLGVVAMALSETEVHPRSRIKTSLFTILCFAITASTVELLTPYTVAFGITLVIASFLLLLTGGINQHYRRITFGILLLVVYTMLGINEEHPWYAQSIYFSIGAFIYSSISVGLLYWSPWRIINELMSVGYYKLSDYAISKSALFPSSTEKQDEIRSQLAQINIDLSTQINHLKFELDSFYREASGKSNLKIKNYYYKWNLLQELHTRFASSHERYDLLSQKTKNPELIEGFGQLMRELGNAIGQYAESFLTERAYQHPISLRWTASALKQLLERHNTGSQYTALSLLLKNLLEVERLLQALEQSDVCHIETIISQKSENISFIKLFNFKNSRFRFSFRLTICYLIAYLLIIFADISKGGWLLMTCLIISQQTYSATNERLMHRILGTIGGVIVGVTLNKILPTEAGQLILLFCSIFAFFYWLQSNYTIAVVAITTFVLAIFNIQTGTGVSVMTPRIVDTLIAAALVFLATRFLWPDWQYKRLPKLLKVSLQDNLVYFENLGNPEKRSQAQRKAHQADSELAMAWKNMLSEPKDKRWFLQNAYNLSYLNHSLLSYISAFDTQRFYPELTDEEVNFCKQINLLLQEALVLTVNPPCEDDILNKIKYYQKWENQLFDLKKTTQNPKILLIHNIGRVALELLMETNELVRKK